MNAIAFIFARGGSKGLPGKNILPLAGKPLIAWAIEHAKAIERIQRIVVSTDSKEIAEVALKYGAEVPFLRPAELAHDDSPELDSWHHALKFILAKEGELPDVMVSVPVTAPLRIPLDIERCLDSYQKHDVDTIVTVTEAHRNPYFNIVKENLNGTLELVIQPDISVSRRQDAPKTYDMTTVAYVTDPKFIISKNSIFAGRVKAVHVPPDRAIDIDTMLDFKIAEFIFHPGRKK